MGAETFLGRLLTTAPRQSRCDRMFGCLTCDKLVPWSSCSSGNNREIGESWHAFQEPIRAKNNGIHILRHFSRSLRGTGRLRSTALNI